MFGSMFLEEGSDFPAVSGVSSTSFGEQPAKRRSSNKLCGLLNQGATCYLNSLIQTLFMTRELRDAFFQLDREQLGEVDGGKEEVVRKIPVELRRLFSRLLLLDVNSVSTASLTDSFGWSGSEVVQQHDVQELNRILFTALDDSLIGTDGSTLIKRLYHGELVNQIRCLSCGHSSERRESFLDICVPLASACTLESALGSQFCEKESLTGANQYHCSSCNKKVDAQKGAVLRQLPQILTVSLLRFQYDWQKGERFKETGRLSFPERLDMSPFCMSQGNDADAMFELFSVVIHRGSAHGGHYFAYIRDVDVLGAWSKPGEGSVLVNTDTSMDLEECNSPHEVLVTLLTQLKKKSPSQSVNQDLLCKKLQEQTGMSWNKRFRKKFGPLMKFLQSNSDTFIVSESGSISLCDNLVNAADHASGSPATLPLIAERKADDGQSSSQAAAGAISVEAPQDTDCWFSFNDGWVSPVDKDVLQSTFMGKESAYMLFYRRRNNAEGYGREQASENIPVHLQVEVAQENSTLEEQREAYRVAANTIKINVHHASDFCNRYGLAERTTGAPTQISVDRQKGFAQLADAIGSSTEKMPSVFIVRCGPAGLHLLQQVFDDTPSLADAGLMASSHILIFNGTEDFSVDDLLLGEENSPIEVSLQLDDGSGSENTLSRPFSKVTSVKDVVTSLCQLAGVQVPRKIQFSSSNRDEEHLSLSLDDPTISLESAGFTSPATITLPGESPPSGKPLESRVAPIISQDDNPQFVEVENLCSSTSGVGTWTSKQIQITSDMTIGDIKRRVIEGDAAAADSIRLREYRLERSCPPLYDSCLVADVKSDDNMVLVLEVGSSPHESELLVYFKLDGKSLNVEYEVVLHRSQTVQDCVEAMCIACGQQQGDWYVQQLAWDSSKALVLDDPTATIDSTGVSNGDHLLLMAGSPLARDAVRLSVYVPTAMEVPCSNPEHGRGVMNWLTSMVSSSMSLATSSTQGETSPAADAPASQDPRESNIDPPSSDGSSKPTAEEPTSPFTFVCTIDVKRAAKVAELKEVILSLPMFSKLPSWPIEKLRVRHLANMQPQRIFRQADTVRSLKCGTKMDNVLCELLSNPEQLPQASIVLRVCQRNQAKRSYGEEQEVVFRTEDGCTLAGLKECIVEHFKLNVHASDIVCAKHLPDQFDWLLLVDEAQPKPRAAGGKGGSTKQQRSARKPPSLRNGPVHLQDGDRIGFKVAVDRHAPSHNDFRTAADQHGRQLLEAAREEKRAARSARHAEVASEAKAKRTEVGIRIVVPQYQSSS